MRIGVTGHQKRDGIDWPWTRDALRCALLKLPTPLEGWSSLAIGADQLFARTILEAGGEIVTVVPGRWYEKCFDGAGLESYRELLARGETIVLDELHGEEAFLAAGLEVVDRTELLIAIWDGEPSKGKGGTADVVEHAMQTGKPVLRLDPIARTSGKVDQTPGR